MPADKHNEACVREAVCVHTKKVYDSCRDRDCVEDVRVYLTMEGQNIIDRAINVKSRKAELLWVYIDVEPVTFNRGFYTVDVKYFYKVTVDAFTTVGRPITVCGLATFDKRVILFGSEGNAKVFSSAMNPDGLDSQFLMRSNLPTACVETVDPVLLDVKVIETRHCPHRMEAFSEIPQGVCGCFEDELVLSDGEKRLFCTLGQFSIIKLERDSQLLMPAYDFCVPEKECLGSNDAGPCDLFNRIGFPTDEFFPPDRVAGIEDFNPGCGCC